MYNTFNLDKNKIKPKGKIMKISKKIIITIFSALVVISCYALTFVALTPKNNQSESPKRAETPPVFYIVKQHNDRIAVFINGKDEPLQILDSPFVRDLPEYDQLILSEGIMVKNNEELLKILEDYDN